MASSFLTVDGAAREAEKGDWVVAEKVAGRRWRWRWPKQRINGEESFRL